MNLREQKSILYLLVLLCCLLKSNALRIPKVFTQPIGRAKVGETAKLICQQHQFDLNKKEWYDNCIWTHESSNCSFHGRNSPVDKPPDPDRFDQPKRCAKMKKRVLFKAFPPDHKCAIDLKNIKYSDHGEWRCDLEISPEHCSRSCKNHCSSTCQTNNTLTLKVTPGI